MWSVCEVTVTLISDAWEPNQLYHIWSSLTAFLRYRIHEIGVPWGHNDLNLRQPKSNKFVLKSRWTFETNSKKSHKNITPLDTLLPARRHYKLNYNINSWLFCLLWSKRLCDTLWYTVHFAPFSLATSKLTQTLVAARYHTCRRRWCWKTCLLCRHSHSDKGWNNMWHHCSQTRLFSSS